MELWVLSLLVLLLMKVVEVSLNIYRKQQAVKLHVVNKDLVKGKKILKNTRSCLRILRYKLQNYLKQLQFSFWQRNCSPVWGIDPFKKISQICIFGNSSFQLELVSLSYMADRLFCEFKFACIWQYLFRFFRLTVRRGIFSFKKKRRKTI